jgi:hypothetical protein
MASLRRANVHGHACGTDEQHTCNVDKNVSDSSFTDVLCFAPETTGMAMKGSCSKWACMTSSFWLKSRRGRMTQQREMPSRASASCKFAGA